MSARYIVTIAILTDQDVTEDELHEDLHNALEKTELIDSYNIDQIEPYDDTEEENSENCRQFE